MPPIGEMGGAKSIKDSVWGMIHLEPAEIVVIDSPPFQRLRHVKQLGTTFYTFPTAAYSRFEHALGVMHQVTRMVDAIQKRSQVGKIEKERSAARLACLLHDIGHLPLSHLTERHFNDYPEPIFEEGLAALQEQLEVDTSLSEFLSFLIIQSDSFRKLLVSHAQYPSEAVDSASLAIVGFPPPGKEFLKQLVSNIIDADKLDYMFRDSQYTSVPLPVDLDRLLYKLKLLPDDRNTQDGKRAGGYLAVDLGGSHLIEDLIVARRILSRQVYRHHKTLAAEQLVLDILRELKPEVSTLLARGDEYFSLYQPHPGCSSLASELLEGLEYRRLPRRAIAYSYSLLPRQTGTSGQPEVQDADKHAWIKFDTALKDSVKRIQLSEKVLSTFKRLATLLGQPTDAAKRVYFDRVGGPKSPEAELFVERPDGTIEQFLPLAPTAAAFAHSPEDFTYAFYTGKAEAGPLVHIACEIVLHDEFRLRLTRGSADHAKIKYAEVESTKNRIAIKDPSEYEKRWVLRARSQQARSQPEVIKDLAAIFSRFRTGPDSDRIIAFLDQFPEHLVRSAVKMLQGVQFIKDEEAVAVIKEGLQKAGLEDNTLVPITRLGESSGIVAYYLAKEGLKVKDLAQASNDKDRKITFFEDTCFSGKQAASVFLTWFGLPPISESDTAPELNEEQKKWLRAADISFAFYVARDEGTAFLKEEVQKQLKINIKEAISLSASKWKTLANAGLDANEHELLQHFMKQVGKSILSSTKAKKAPDKWTDALCDHRALGYTGVPGLTVTQTNVPTSTATLLWLEGEFRETNWKPLFPRNDPN